LEILSGYQKILQENSLDALHHIRYIALQHQSLMFLLQTLLWWLFIAEASPAPAFFCPGAIPAAQPKTEWKGR